MWLEAPVEGDGREGERPPNDPEQGPGDWNSSRVSDLTVVRQCVHAAFVKGWKTGGHEKRLDARIINYADDIVICCRGTAEEAMNVMRTMMSKLKLTTNEQEDALLPPAGRVV